MLFKWCSPRQPLSYPSTAALKGSSKKSFKVQKNRISNHRNCNCERSKKWWKERIEIDFVWISHACILRLKNTQCFTFCGFFASLPTGENCISRKKFTFVFFTRNEDGTKARRENPLTLTSQIANTHIWMRIYVWCLCNASQDVLHSFSRCMFLMCTWKTHRLILIYMQLPLWKNSYNAKATHIRISLRDGYFLQHPAATPFAPLFSWTLARRGIQMPQRMHVFAFYPFLGL